MKYIVTGGAGFLGSNLVDHLISEGNEVHIFDNFSTGKEENCNKKGIYHKLDISDSKLSTQFIKIMDGSSGIFHCAARARVQPSIDDPIAFEKNNTVGTINMLKCAVDAKIPRFVYSASSSAYGNRENMPLKETDPVNPISPYALQKYYGEIACRMFNQVYGIETVSLRYFNIYGERQSLEGAYTLVIGTFAKQRLNNELLTIRGDGEQRRDFTYVKDVVHANILSMNSDKVGNGEVINIGNGDNRSVNEIATMIGGDTVNVDPVVEPRETLADNTKAKELLDWEPTEKIENWIKKYKNELGIN